jgi:hypothetical protein
MFRGDGPDRAAIAIVEQWNDFSGLKFIGLVLMGWF